MIVTETGESPSTSGSPEIQNKAVEATLLAEDELHVILVSFMLLGMFVVVFMGYLILDAAHLL